MDRSEGCGSSILRAGKSTISTGWSAFDRDTKENEGGLTATLAQREEDAVIPLRYNVNLYRL